MPAFAADIFSSTDVDGQVRWSTQAWDASYERNVPLSSPQVIATSPQTSRNATAPSKAQIQMEKRRLQFYPMVDRVARRHGVDTDLVMALIEVESGFHNQAISPKGARGLMQLLPATATRYGMREVRELHDPERNIEIGVQHVKDLLNTYGGHPALAMAAYNAGPQAVAKYGQRIPHYVETMLYVPAVLAGIVRHAPIATASRDGGLE